jgi:hypothetical protein
MVRSLSGAESLDGVRPVPQPFAYADFWPVVIVQAAATLWVLSLMLRALGFGGRPLVMLGVIAALSGLTTLPWLTSILLTDIFAGLAVLAVHLLVFADGTLRRLERIALVALIAFAVATHSASFAVAVALLAAAALAWWYLRIGSASGIARGMAAVLGAAMLVSANYVVAGKLAWTPAYSSGAARAACSTTSAASPGLATR